MHLIAAAALSLGGACATAPKTADEKADLYVQADTTLRSMKNRDPGLAELLNRSAGYVVFPDIGKGGLIVGGAYGRGILYENGRRKGFVELNQASIGAQVGAQTFSELIVFTNPLDVSKLKMGDFSLGANVSAVALTTGAAASVDTNAGTYVFVVPKGGVMAELSVSGQKLNFEPAGG
jgi:lipid-binding SYLF domain-containing protein